eukprot:jgi/Mesen1/2266/ME000154S01436
MASALCCKAGSYTVAYAVGKCDSSRRESNGARSTPSGGYIRTLASSSIQCSSRHRTIRQAGALLKHGSLLSPGFCDTILGSVRRGPGYGSEGKKSFVVYASDLSQTPTSPIPPSESKGNNPFTALARFIQSFWRQVSLPLGNFGFGKRSIWEGGVGLFVVTGVVMLAMLITWIKGVQVRSRSSKYQAVVEFSQACGITVGTPVRIRGVDVGSVVGVKPSLEKIDVVVEVMDGSVVIPRNSLVEVNQSGLISETLIDITPVPPIPRPTIGPLDPRCKDEGLIVCDREHIVGSQGVSLDELVGICTKIAKQVDKEGIHHAFDTMKTVTNTVADYKPFLDKGPHGLGGAHLVATWHVLGQHRVHLAAGQGGRAEAAGGEAKHASNANSISSDVSGLTGDPGTRYNLKQLIESLSRLVSD